MGKNILFKINECRETRAASQEWTSLWREKKSGVELQTCLHITAEVAVLCPELEDGTRGTLHYFYSAVIIKIQLRNECL